MVLQLLVDDRQYGFSSESKDPLGEKIGHVPEKSEAGRAAGYPGPLFSFIGAEEGTRHRPACIPFNQ
jgi:hypothetical protein